MTNSNQVGETCDLVLRKAGYVQQGNSNCYLKMQHSKVYVFGEEGPTQSWRYHISSGSSWPIKAKGDGPADLDRYLRENG